MSEICDDLFLLYSCTDTLLSLCIQLTPNASGKVTGQESGAPKYLGWGNKKMVFVGRLRRTSQIPKGSPVPQTMTGRVKFSQSLTKKPTAVREGGETSRRADRQ